MKEESAASAVDHLTEIKERTAKEEEEISRRSYLEQAIYWKQRAARATRAGVEAMCNAVKYKTERDLALSTAGTDARHKKNRTAKARAGELAAELLKKNPALTIADGAYGVWSELRSEGFDVGEKAVRGWITHLWPPEAHKPGRRKSPN